MNNLKPIIILSLLLAILAIPTLTHAEPLQCDEFNFELDCYSNHDTDDDLSGYNIGNPYVIYDYCKVKCADKDTFDRVKNITEEGSDTYGRDKSYLFYGRKRLDGINPDDFQSKTMRPGDYYLVYGDKATWLNGVRYDTFDPATLEFLDIDFSTRMVYLKDKNHVYTLNWKNDMYSFSPVILRDADPDYFGFGYNITDNAVYWYGKKIDEVDLESFELLYSGFAKDKNNVYYEGSVDREIDAKSFHRAGIEGIEIYIYLDDKGSYYGELGTIGELIKKYPNSKEEINQSLQTAIKTYESKYPGYTPKPAQPKQIFKDIPVEDQYYESTKQANNQGWIDGYSDGNFKPNKTVNRAEFAKMLVLAFYLGQGDGWNLKKFPDVLMDQWYIPHLSMAVERGMMEGYPDTMMRPANTINRAEALKMTLELIGKKADESNINKDAAWYQKYRLYAVENFDLDFVRDEQMGESMTRGECVDLILEASQD